MIINRRPVGTGFGRRQAPAFIFVHIHSLPLA
jgi:hypothetical protein